MACEQVQPYLKQSCRILMYENSAILMNHEFI
jgi:hypothetical protein